MAIVAEVKIEEDFWSGGHSHKGYRKEVKLLKAFQNLTPGAKLLAGAEECESCGQGTAGSEGSPKWCCYCGARLNSGKEFK